MTGMLRRLLPQTMAGQLVGLLFCGLLAAHLIALLATASNGGNGTLHRMSRRYVMENVTSAYRLALVQRDAASGNAMLAALDTATSRHRIGPRSAVADPLLDEEERSLQAALQRELRLPADAVHVSLAPGTRTDQDPGLAIALRLPAGWFNSAQRPLANTQWWWKPLRFSIPVSTLPVLVICIVFVRRIVRPIKALSQGAERVSRGEYEPLALSGPREAREVTASFNLMQERLTRYLEDHKRMLASISHDLRSMVTSLRLRAELVDDDEVRAGMQRTLRDMAAMIEETLRFSRDDAYDEPTIGIDLGAMAGEIAADQAAQGRDVALVGAAASPASSASASAASDAASAAGLPALPCRCRPLAIRRALTNLVDNAVRYGGRARIGVSRTQIDGGRDAIRITIDDDGPGIPAARLDDVFKPFYRLDTARHPELGGVGLGLAIARSCIDAHGGNVTLSNRPTGGLRATILLPA
ncbi:ATP-binding protein [Pseudoduganella sp. SL102]|uniref:ATP-binding protein n=1 Tax=Pseudoduganella sp. SL102 TaxID=2995154 RepID=UPI00248BE36A|nr:ATP-binding protein [Pseudoduganella sp. SL102]WBS02684.1 ATP-binding protein [Pseudoduganella sp. SL102]